MKILLSNDDGIRARGMRILYELLQELGHQVHIVAAEQQASGSSHALTLLNPLVPKKIWEGDKLYGIAVNGLPTDAVKLGVVSFYPDVEMVISGINLGNNAGPAIYYSGTIAAAFEGVIAGRPALAFSFDSFHERDMEGLKDRLSPFMPTFLELRREGILYNINIPNTTKIKGVKLTRHFQGFFIDHYDKRIDPKEREYYWLTNTGYSPEKNGVGHAFPHDLAAMGEGYISLTPLQFDFTAYQHLPALVRQFPQGGKRGKKGQASSPRPGN